MRRIPFLPLLFLAVLVLAAGCGEGRPPAEKNGKKAAFSPNPELRAAMEAFRDGRDVEAASSVILHSDMPALALYDYLRLPRTFSPDEPGWKDGVVTFEDGYSLSYVWRVPIDYDPSVPHPVLVVLHGGVSTPKPYPLDTLKEYGDGFAEVFSAVDASAFVLVPQGSREAPWWTMRGTRMVLEPLRRLRQRYNIDPDRVFVTGFSDGGSGCWFLASARPTPFAAFFPFNGMMAVAARYFPVFIGNLTNGRPIYACNTTEDRLYPPAAVRPFIAAMREAGVKPLTFRMFEGIGHAFGYGKEITADVSDMLLHVRRDYWHPTVRYAVLADSASRCDWVRVALRGPNRNPADLREPTVVVRGGMRLGIIIDTTWENKGVKVAKVAEKSNAARMGIRTGDVITVWNGKEIAEARELPPLIAATRPGSTVQVTVLRDGKRLVLRGEMRLPPPSRFLAYGEEPSIVRVTREGNRFTVEAKGVRRLLIAVAPGFVDFDEPVTVVANGEEVFRGMVKPALEAVVRSYMRDFDPSALAAAYIDVEIP